MKRIKAALFSEGLLKFLEGVPHPVLEITVGHQPFSDQFQYFDQPKFILFGQIYCTFSIGSH